MRVRIIASKPIDKGCSGIENYIGQEFDTYREPDGTLMTINKPFYDFILFEGEYEIVEK